MQIVIDIPEDMYKDICYRHLIIGGMRSGKTVLMKLFEAIRKGVVLPKGHGRLIDADELLKHISDKCKIPSLNLSTINELCGATAIVYDMLIETGQETEEADKAESEDKE